MASGGEAITSSDTSNFNGNTNANSNSNSMLTTDSDNAVGGVVDNAIIGDDNEGTSLQSMHAFYPRCGRRITLSNGNRTATRSVRDFSHALVFSAEPLTNDVLFEVIIERKSIAWGGNVKIGVTQEPPDQLELHSSTTAMRNGTWVISGTEVRFNGECINEFYGPDLETLDEGDRLGVMRTNKDDLVVYVNGESLGVAAFKIPRPVWALVNLYGRCVQVSLCPVQSESSNGDSNEIVQLQQQEHQQPSENSQQQNQEVTQSINMPLSVDVTVATTTVCNTTVTDITSISSQSRDHARSAARNFCSSIFSSIQNNNTSSSNTNQPLISSGATSVVNAQNSSGDFYDMNEPMRFHTRCGSLVKLSTNFRSAERRRPLDEFNNGVVITHRPLKDNELFEIRIDKLVDKWSGSIEVGVTTHNPTVLHFPATMTNMRSGTIMMSGCGILTNGKGTRRQYGEFNLDELAEGDRVGMMRKSNANLHYYINGQDQGVAATRVATTLWGVIDLYGMTIKVTIVDRDEREQQNLVTRRNNMLLTTAAAVAAASAASASATANAASASMSGLVGATGSLIQPTVSGSTPLLGLQSPDSDIVLNGCSIIASRGGGDCLANAAIASCSMNASINSRNEDRLTFNPLCGQHAQVTHSGRTALRPNASDDFNNGVVITRRPLRSNELFQVRLERVVSKWAGSVEMGVTIYSAEELDFPFTMTNVRTGTWMMTGNGVMQNGITVIEQYGQNLDRLQVGDRVGVMRKFDGTLHFFVNGVDQGLAATGVPERVYGVIDLYGQAAQASIVDTSECGSPDTGNSTISNTTLYSEPPLRFHTVHGKNAVISNGGLTASRPNSLAEFNDSIVFSNRPLRQRELFEVILENMVRHWSGNVEIGVTGTRPEDLNLSANATDLEGGETIILCGSMLFYNRKTIRSNVPMDLDSLSSNARVGVMRNGDYIHFYINGIDQGPACECRSLNVWAIVDLYGQCAQVSLTQIQPPEIPRVAPYATSENSQSCQATSVIQPATLETKHRWTCVSGTVQLSQNWTVASRLSGTSAALTRCLVFSENPLRLGSPFEIRILVRNPMLAGSLSIGITDLNLSDYVRRNLPVNIRRIPANVWYLSGNELRHNMRLLQRSATSLEWLRAGDRISLELTTGRTLRVLFNSEDMNIHFKHVAMNPYVVVELSGSTMAIQAISSQVPMSPLRPGILRLQDSLDFGADPLNKQDSMLESMESEAINFEFLERYGSNIRLQNECRTAIRTSSFNNGIVFGNKPMCKGETISVKIDKINLKWQGTIGVGVVGFYPINLERVPQSLLHLTRRCWGLTKEYININGQRIPSNYGDALDSIQVGTVITLSLNFANMLIITVGNTTLEELGTIPNVVYPIFDLYGKCEQITAQSMPANNDALLNNGSANTPPTATAPSVEATVFAANSVCAITNLAQASLVNGVLAEVVEEEVLAAYVDTETEHSLSREKADLECHEKETNDSIEPVPTAEVQQSNDADEEYDDDDGLPAVHSSPASTNLALDLNRSVMESVSENLLMNISIKIRSLEQQTRQSEMSTSGSSSTACCLRDSLQLQHFTNLNIQRSQSTQRFPQQQQQQPLQLQTSQNPSTSSGAAAVVQDTNKSQEALEESIANLSLHNNEDNSASVTSVGSISSTTNEAHGNMGGAVGSSATATTTAAATTSTITTINTTARNRVPMFRTFFANEVFNDSSSTSTNSSSPGRSDRQNSLNEENIGRRTVAGIFEAALNECSSTSSDSPRDRYNSLSVFGRSATSSDSSGGMSLHAVGPARILNHRVRGSLRLNDHLIMDSSSNSSIGDQNPNDANDDGFVTIMAPNPNWRSHSPSQDENRDSPHENNNGENDLIEIDDSNSNLRRHASALITAAARFNMDSTELFGSIERRDCAYLKLVKQFFASLILPQVFFSSSIDAICFCSGCNSSQQTKLNGWVYWFLNKTMANAHEPPASLMESGQYLCMYFVTRVDKIRSILDYGQLVPQDSTRENEYSSTSGQKDEPGTRLELHFAPDVVTAMSKNAQHLFTQNGKQYRIGAAFEVFVRQQALCSLPSSSFGVCHSNRSDLHSLPNNSAIGSNISLVSTGSGNGNAVAAGSGGSVGSCGSGGAVGGCSAKTSLSSIPSNASCGGSSSGGGGAAGGSGSGSGSGTGSGNTNVSNSDAVNSVIRCIGGGGGGLGSSGSGSGSGNSSVCNNLGSRGVGSGSSNASATGGGSSARSNTSIGGCNSNTSVSGGGSARGNSSSGSGNGSVGSSCNDNQSVNTALKNNANSSVNMNTNSNVSINLSTNVNVNASGSAHSGISVNSNNSGARGNVSARGGNSAGADNSAVNALEMSSIAPTDSNGSLGDLTWFTKEDGACFINALVLRLEELKSDEVPIKNTSASNGFHLY